MIKLTVRGKGAVTIIDQDIGFTAVVADNVIKTVSVEIGGGKLIILGMRSIVPG